MTQPLGKIQKQSISYPLFERIMVTAIEHGDFINWGYLAAYEWPAPEENIYPTIHFCKLLWYEGYTASVYDNETNNEIGTINLQKVKTGFSKLATASKETYKRLINGVFDEFDASIFFQFCIWENCKY